MLKLKVHTKEKSTICMNISNRNSKQCEIIEHNTKNLWFLIYRRKKLALKERELRIFAQESATKKGTFWS